MTLDDFHLIAKGIEALAQTQSTLEKESLLRVYGRVDGFKDIMRHIYNPYITTGLKLAKLIYAQPISLAPTVDEALEYFSVTRTGNLADADFAVSFIDQFSSEDEATEYAIATAIVTKELRCGVSVTTLNKVYGSNFIPTIGIMRGKLAPSSFAGVYIATEKIDGNRRLFFNTAEGVNVYTRSGKPDYGLTELCAEIHKYLPKGYVYDCECTKIGNFNDNIELRQASAAELNQTSREKIGVRAQCFDMVSIPSYFTARDNTTAMIRKARLARLFNDTHGLELLKKTGLLESSVGYVVPGQEYTPEDIVAGCKHITSLPILAIVHNDTEALKVAQPVWDNHGEGIMLVDITSPYIVAATPQRYWLKIKATEEIVALCIGVYEGTNKYQGCMGGITVAFRGPDGKAYTCNVGSGFTDGDRQVYFDQPERIKNKLVELDYFGLSRAKNTTAYSLNCPIFKRIVNTEE